MRRNFEVRDSRIYVLALVGVAAAGIVLAQRGGGGMAAGSAPFDPHDVSGYWELGPESKSIPPADLLPVITKAMLDKARDADLISYRWCRPLGLPALMDGGRPIDIEQGQHEIIITTEINSSPRHIYFNRPHVNADIFDPSSVGDSIAHWDGDTLVVDTIGFHARNGRMLIPGGGFRTENSHLVEHFKLLKNGTILSVESTWTDPKVFRTPHSYEYRYTKLDAKYEPRPGIACDPYDEDRTAFVERTFSPALKAAAEAAMVKPGTPVDIAKPAAKPAPAKPVGPGNPPKAK